MARGNDTSKHPNRQVGRTSLFDLDTTNPNNPNVGVTWSGARGGREDVPLSDLVHHNPDSKLHGKAVKIKHLKDASSEEATTKGGFGDPVERANITVRRKN